MNYTLVYLVKPDKTDRKKTASWHTMLESIDSPESPAKDKGRIAENVWLLERDSDLSALAKVVLESDEHQIERRVLYLSDE